MNICHLQQSYKNLLVETGKYTPETEKASKDLTFDELRIIGEIWSEWGSVFTQQAS